MIKIKILIISILAGGLLVPSAIATHQCKDISDLDDRAKCYEEEIEEKQEEYESTSKKLDDIRDKKDNIENTIEKYKGELNVTQGQINQLQTEINEITNALEEIAENLADRNEKLKDKIEFRNKVVRNYAKTSLRSNLEVFFAQAPKDVALTGFQYDSFSYLFRKALTDEAARLIKLLGEEIVSFEKDKAEAETLKQELETSQANLLALKAELDTKRASAENEYGVLSDKAEDYEEKLFDLKDEIASLTAKQQEIINLKSGGENGSVGEYAPTKVSTPSPPFKPAFAAFSYGAYTHYNGMSQYGAKGRAEDGKDYKDIIEHYYKSGVKKKDDFPKKISVQGHGDLDYQYYLYGIAEMPSSWPMDALKAQAIAARTYAYRTGKPICTTQSCQVFLKSKADNPPDRWKEAVDETKNMILENDSSTSQYSSTTGGYLNQSGWDVDGKWPNDAYENKAGSPWFRKAWYTKSYNDSNNCGRAHPWLNEEEMADILNALKVWEKGSGSEKDRISPVTTSCWGGNPYSINDMREKADKYGGGYKKVTSVKVDVGNNGQTNKVTLTTDKGTVSVDGQTFKTVYNLRAPSYIAIRSRLYDFDKED